MGGAGPPAQSCSSNHTRLWEGGTHHSHRGAPDTPSEERRRCPADPWGPTQEAQKGRGWTWPPPRQVCVSGSAHTCTCST